jgi:hypothetical protein
MFYLKVVFQLPDSKFVKTHFKAIDFFNEPFIVFCSLGVFNFTFCCTNTQPRDVIEYTCKADGQIPSCDALHKGNGHFGFTCFYIRQLNNETRWSYVSCANAPVVYRHCVDHVLLGIMPPRFRLDFTPHNHTVLPQNLEPAVVNCSWDDKPGLYSDCLLDSECQVGSPQCPRTGVTCQGQVTSRNKCFFT